MMKNVRGETPLDLAAQFGHLDTVSLHNHRLLYLRHRIGNMKISRVHARFAKKLKEH